MLINEVKESPTNLLSYLLTCYKKHCLTYFQEIVLFGSSFIDALYLIDDYVSVFAFSMASTKLNT